MFVQLSEEPGRLLIDARNRPVKMDLLINATLVKHLETPPESECSAVEKQDERGPSAGSQSKKPVLSRQGVTAS